MLLLGATKRKRSLHVDYHPWATAQVQKAPHPIIIWQKIYNPVLLEYCLDIKYNIHVAHDAFTQTRSTIDD